MSLFDSAKEFLGVRTSSLEQEVVLSEEARQIIGSPIVTRYFEDTERNIVERWKGSAPQDVEGREKAFQFLALLQDFKGYFEKHLDGGIYAQQELERILSDEKQS